MTERCGIEIRGKYSALLPQNLTDPNPGSWPEIILMYLFWNAPENDWTLLACYNDKTFLRNFLLLRYLRNGDTIDKIEILRSSVKMSIRVFTCSQKK